LPRFSFSPESSFILFIHFLVDIQLIYFFLILPLNFVLNIQTTTIAFTDQFFNGIYFFHLCFTFRTLIYDNMNNLKKNLNEIFRITIKNPLTYLDLLSLFPLEILYSDEGDPANLSEDSYFYLKFIILLRVFRFGKTIDFWEKTKWALIFRLIVLI